MKCVALALLMLMVKCYNAIENCGQPANVCLCDDSTKSIICIGEAVVRLPIFSRYRMKNTVLLRIEGTGLYVMQSLKHVAWQSLRTVVLRDNAFMNCAITMKNLKETFGNKLLIVTDCSKQKAYKPEAVYNFTAGYADVTLPQEEKEEGIIATRSGINVTLYTEAVVRDAPLTTVYRDYKAATKEMAAFATHARNNSTQNEVSTRSVKSSPAFRYDTTYSKDKSSIEYGEMLMYTTQSYVTGKYHKLNITVDKSFEHPLGSVIPLTDEYTKAYITTGKSFENSPGNKKLLALYALLPISIIIVAGVCGLICYRHYYRKKVPIYLGSMNPSTDSVIGNVTYHLYECKYETPFLDCVA